MKHIKLFETLADYSVTATPQVSYIKETKDVKYDKAVQAPEEPTA